MPVTTLADAAAANLARVIGALGGTPREGQVAMVRAAAEAIEHTGRVAVEAPTGTGKSLGALVPVVTDGRPALVVTASIALQDQLIGKDLPFVASVLNPGLQFHAVKGRSRTVCPAKLEHAGMFVDERLRVWAFDESLARERTDCPVDLSDDEWAEISVAEDECPGKRACRLSASCPAELARDRMATADVVVTNMHLFTRMLGSEALARFHTIVVDETHDLVDSGCAAKQITVTPRRIMAVADGLKRHVSSTLPVIDEIRDVAELWRNQLPMLARDGSLRLRGGVAGDQAVTVLVGRALTALGKVVLPRASEHGLKMLSTRLQRLSTELGGLRDVDSWACWVDRRGLHASPLSIRFELAGAAWAERAVVLCSATMPSNVVADTGLDLDVAMERDESTGRWVMDGCRPFETPVKIKVRSPFNLQDNLRLYVAADLPDPTGQTREAFDAECVVRVSELVAASAGGALVLCTSLKAVERHAARLALDGHRVLAQGEMERSRLLDRFRADRDSVLVASRSFFQGVDVPGDACRLVVIDRILFPTPDDPLANARREQIQQGLVSSGRAPSFEKARWPAFVQLDVPAAATAMAQAVGRLVRHEDDRGVVAVLDPRLATKAYGAQILSELPVRPTVDLSSVLRTLEAWRPAGASPVAGSAGSAAGIVSGWLAAAASR